MNHTNRALNRIFIFVIGAILLAAGTAAIGLAVLTDWSKLWQHSVSTLRGTILSTLKNTALAATGHSWLLIALPVAALLVIVLLLVFIFRQGRGHTNSLLSARETATLKASRGASTGAGSADDGSVSVDATVAEKVISNALAGRPELLSSGVSTYRVKGHSALKITVTPRRGASPKDVQRGVEELLEAWDKVLGREVPVLIHITGGLRARITKESRIQ